MKSQHDPCYCAYLWIARVVRTTDQRGESLLGQIQAVGSATQICEVDPSLHIFVWRQDERADLEDALPHFDVSLAAIESEVSATFFWAHVHLLRHVARCVICLSGCSAWSLYEMISSSSAKAWTRTIVLRKVRLMIVAQTIEIHSYDLP